METIDAYKAKTHFPELLERVTKGERITITKHGLPVAVLQSPPISPKAEPKTIIAELRKFRGERSFEGLSIRDMIEEGRR